MSRYDDIHDHLPSTFTEDYNGQRWTVRKQWNFAAERPYLEYSDPIPLSALPAGAGPATRPPAPSHYTRTAPVLDPIPATPARPDSGAGEAVVTAAAGGLAAVAAVPPVLPFVAGAALVVAAVGGIAIGVVFLIDWLDE